MKSTILFLLILFFAFNSCKKDGVGTPKCVERKIDKFAKETCERSNVKVDEYTFQGKTVYVFNQDACGNDMTAEVIDSDCKTLGYLGGFVGNTVINGEDFSKAKFERNVWEK